MKENAKTSSTGDARNRFEQLVKSGALRACERHVAGAHDAEDRVAEGLGLTWKWYQGEVAKGNNPDLALVRHACRMRTVDRSHRLDSGDRRRWPQCVYQQAGRGAIELRRLQFVELEDDRFEEDLSVGLAEPGAVDPTPKLDSALDLESWLGTLSARERTMLALRQAGYGLEAIGRKLKCTSSTTWKDLRDLGRELADRAGITIERRRRRSPPLRGLPPAVRDAIAVTP
jgi:hypothetical protein